MKKPAARQFIDHAVGWVERSDTHQTPGTVAMGIAALNPSLYKRDALRRPVRPLALMRKKLSSPLGTDPHQSFGARCTRTAIIDVIVGEPSKVAPDAIRCDADERIHDAAAPAVIRQMTGFRMRILAAGAVVDAASSRRALHPAARDGPGERAG